MAKGIKDYPTSLDTVTNLPTMATLEAIEMDGDGTPAHEHAAVDGVAHGAIVALETKLGIGASTPVAGAIMIGSAAGVSGWDTTPQILTSLAIGGAIDPGQVLYVTDGSAGAVTPSSTNSQFTLESDDNAGMTMLSPANRSAIIYYGSPTSPTQGWTQYNHSLDRFLIGVAAGDRFYFENGIFNMNQATTVQTSSGALTLTGSSGVVVTRASSLPLEVRQSENTGGAVSVLNLVHDRGNGNAAVGDELQQNFYLLDDNNVERLFAHIRVEATDVATAGVDGILEIAVVEGGSLSSGNKYQIRAETAGVSSHRWIIEAAEVMRYEEGTGLLIGDTANANMTVGLTINQGAADNEILSLKSSDVGHSFTDEAEADTYARFGKAQPTVGGLEIRAYTETVLALELYGVAQTPTTSDTTTSDGSINVHAMKTDGGTTTANLADTENLFAIQNKFTTRHIIKGNGDWHAAVLDGTNSDSIAAVLLSDDLPDAMAGRDLRLSILGLQPDTPWVDALEARGVVGPRDFTGHRFMSIQNSIYFSMDMSFQNAGWIRDLMDVLTDAQRDRLPTQTREMLALMPAA